jgi:protein-tyrosine phosphatase
MARFALGFFSLLFLSLFPAPGAQTVENTVAREQHRAFAEKIHIEGVENAGKLNDHLYRGTQPNERGVEELKKLGVTTIVDLRGESRGTSERELQEAHSLGMQFVLIPGDGWAPPSDEQMAQFFSILAERPKHTIFIHCYFGSDRTGVFIAAYRMAFEHWTPGQALAEMYAFHFKGFWHPAMKEYIRKFPERLAASPALAPYRAGEQAPAL